FSSRPHPRPTLFPYTTLFRSQIAGEVESYQDIQRAFRAGRARVALVVPARFQIDLARGGARAQLVVDGSDPQTVASASEAAGQIDRKSTRLNSSHDQISYAVF